MTGIPFAAGEFIEFREPNAAGYGDPLDRPPEQVRADLLDDFTTIELARDAYGVVFADEQTLEIDREATDALRAKLREGPRGELADGALRRGRAPPRERARVCRRQRGVRDRLSRVATKAYEEIAATLRRRVVTGSSSRASACPTETMLATSSASAGPRYARRSASSTRRASSARRRGRPAAAT